MLPGADPLGVEQALGGLTASGAPADGDPPPEVDLSSCGDPVGSGDDPRARDDDLREGEVPPAGGGRLQGGAVKPIKVGWRVRRWLPPGTTQVRLDPGRRAAAVLAIVVLLGVLIAGIGVWRSRPVAEAVPAALPAVTPAASTGDAGELVVSVAGLVARPGLVRLRPGARVADAVTAAGGPLPGVDLSSVNLARRLTDGEHVVVGPAAPAPVGASPGAGPAGPGGSPANGAKVDLNTATMADLDALPGVGPVTAQRILDWRTAHGRFSSVDQLREIEGIGETRFSRLRDLVTA